jgi:hypothetical protein
MSFALRRGVCQDFAQVLNMPPSGRKARIFGRPANQRLMLSLVVREGWPDYPRRKPAHGWPAPGRGGAF